MQYRLYVAYKAWNITLWPLTEKVSQPLVNIAPVEEGEMTEDINL